MVGKGTGSRRVLVIDDDGVIRELLDALLTVGGYQVTTAGSGEEGLTVLADPEPPLLVLTDLQMPGLEGEALTTALRAAAPPAAVVIGMSGRTPSQAVLRPLDGFLSKPFNAESLRHTFAAAQEARASHAGVLLSAAAPATVSSMAHAKLEAASEPLPALDEEIFHALAETVRPPQLLELYRLTLDDVEKRHGRMASHAALGDLGAMRREAHAVKGACGFVGARELQVLAAAVEEGTMPPLPVLEKISVASARLRRMLDTKLHNSGN